MPWGCTDLQYPSRGILVLLVSSKIRQNHLTWPIRVREALLRLGTQGKEIKLQTEHASHTVTVAFARKQWGCGLNVSIYC